MHKLSISISVFCEASCNIAIRDNGNHAWNIKIIEKDKQLRGDSDSAAHQTIISFKKIVRCKKEIDEKKIMNKLEEVFEYINHKGISGRREMYIIYVIDYDQFGFALSSEFMQWLIDHHCGVRLRGVYFKK